LRQSSPVWVVMYSKAAAVKLPNFVDFFDDVTHIHKKQYPICVRIPCGDKNWLTQTGVRLAG